MAQLPQLLEGCLVRRIPLAEVAAVHYGAFGQTAYSFDSGKVTSLTSLDGAWSFNQYPHTGSYDFNSTGISPPTSTLQATCSPYEQKEGASATAFLWAELTFFSITPACKRPR